MVAQRRFAKLGRTHTCRGGQDACKALWGASMKLILRLSSDLQTQVSYVVPPTKPVPGGLCVPLLKRCFQQRGPRPPSAGAVVESRAGFLGCPRPTGSLAERELARERAEIPAAFAATSCSLKSNRVAK